MQLQRPIVYSARRLRREMSPPEAKLWLMLRQRPGGLKFRRQHPIEPFVADFFCREGKLILEVDGWAHDTASVAERDETRDAALAARGFSILRIPAEEVMKDADSVVSAILERVGSPLHWPSAGPPPRSGED
jgi:very-short-patch-repair endonuclease